MSRRLPLLLVCLLIAMLGLSSPAPLHPVTDGDRMRGLASPGYSVGPVPNVGVPRDPGLAAARSIASTVHAAANKASVDVNHQVLELAKAAGLTPQANVANPGDWKADLTPDESWLINAESGGNPTAKNATSTAFGIWQGLDSTRREYGQKLGIDPNTTDPVQQKLMFRAYVHDRYGTAANAVAFHKAHGYY